MDQTEIMRWTSLLLEFIVLFLLIFALVAAKVMKDVKGHYKLLALATALNLIAVLFLMVPRFWDMAAGYVDYGMDATRLGGHSPPHPRWHRRHTFTDFDGPVHPSEGRHGPLP